MPATSGPEALPYPQASDAPDGPGAFLSLLSAMQTGGPWVYPTLIALQAVPGKYVNQLATVNADPTATLNGYYTWNGAQWVLSFGDTGWVPLTYSNGWSDFPGYPALAVRRRNGIVYLSGLGKGGTVSATTLITTVPVGFRIGRDEVIPTVGSGNAACSLEVFPDGTVKTGPSGAIAAWTSLHVSWIAEN